MKILFSPVGNTDPWRNNRDGALLHIVRHYQPDQVILFFTRSIWEGNDRVGGHKEYDWEKLIQFLSPQCKVESEVHEISEEHDFDSYKDIFHEILCKIEKRFSSAEILLNVTSGTPQMEATLCLEYVTQPENKLCIQVSSPLNSSNAKTKFAVPEDQEIDFEIVNEEESQAESRCREINIISFRETLVRNQVKSLVTNYDYEAALFLIRSQKNFWNQALIKGELIRVIECIKNHRVFDEIVGKYGRNSYPGKLLFHYLLLEMRYKRGDSAEALIRVKTIAEYICLQHLRKQYPALVVMGQGGKVQLNYGFSPQLESHFLYENSRNASLPIFEKIINILEPDSSFLPLIKQVMQINNLRNSVAHNFEELDLSKNGEKLTLAVRAVKEMVVLSYPNIAEADFQFFKKFNESIDQLL